MEEVYLMNNLFITFSTVITLSTNVGLCDWPENISNTTAYIDRLIIDNSNSQNGFKKFDSNVSWSNVSFDYNNHTSNCINVSPNTYNCYEVDILKEQQDNLKVLNSFKTLTDNWDECGAIAPKKEIIEIAQNLVKQLKKQPDIFPTPDGGIQFEYDVDENCHLNIELLSKQKIKIFEMFPDRTYTEELLNLDIKNIIQRVDKFYG